MKNTDVTKLIRIASNNIVAKPFTELSPNTNNTSAAKIVVKLASNIVINEEPEPFLKACCKVLPIRNSSFIRSYMMMLASTAIPTPKTKAASPGNVNTPEIKLNATNVK